MNGMNENVLAIHFSTGISFGPEHEHAPQPVDDRRHRGQQVDQHASARARARRGHSSVRNSAVATATGTPMSSAIAEVISVPTTSAAPW